MRLVEQAADGEGVVAHHFGGEAEARTAREEAILGVLFEEFGGDFGGLAVGGRGHDQALHGLHVPVTLKLGGEPVQDVALYGLVALGAEILGGLDEAGAEMKLPVAIDGDARGEGVLRAEEPLGEAQTIRGGVLGHGRKHRRDAGSYLLGLVAIVAAGQDEGVARLGHLGHDLRRRDFFFSLRELRLEGVELGVDAAQFGGGVAGEEVIEEALVLVFGALGFVLREDVADGLVEGEGFGVGGSEGAVCRCGVRRCRP